MDTTTWKDGVIATDSGIVIVQPGMSLNYLLSNPICRSPQLREMSPGQTKVYFDPVIVGGQECDVTAYFGDGIVTHANIELTKNTLEQLSLDTNPWPAPDSSHVAFLREWIRETIGKMPPIDFWWGSIGEVLNSRDGFAHIPFVYKIGAKKSPRA
jgi:hypothetical protein